MKLKFLAAIALSATLYSCDDETVGIGDFIIDDELIHAASASYPVTTESIKLDSVYSRSSTAYLGSFTDEEYGTFKSDFLVQINCPENFSLPDKLYTEDSITKEPLNPIEEVSLGLYYTNYFGDSLATLRVQVDTLNTVIMDNGKDKSLYYSKFDPTKFYDSSKPLLAYKDYSAYDKSISDSIRNATDAQGNKTYYPNVNVDLGKDFCTMFYDKYKVEAEDGSHPNFKDAETFINNVLKGFYVHTTSGDGSVLYLSDIYLRLKFKYWQKREEKPDTVVTGYVQMASTKEVYMTSRFENSNFDGLLADKERTYLKTPAGICTQVTLPLEAMYEKHRVEQQDTLNAVYISFQKMKEMERPFKMGTPSTLLMVRAKDMKDFFEGNKINDNKTSFLASYDAKTATYKFSKLNRLISHIFSEMAVEKEKGEANWEAWKSKKENKDWDKVLLIPVTAETDAQGNVVRVENDLNVNSAILQRGETEENSDIKMEVIYTQPQVR